MPDSRSFAQSFRGIQLRFSRLYAHFLSTRKLTLTQYALLSLLEDHGSFSMREASRLLGLSKPAVTYLTDRLEGKQYLQRVPHPGDRRSYLLKIRPKGTRLVRQGQDLALKILMDSLKGFSAYEKKAIADFYQRLAGRMDRVLK